MYSMSLHLKQQDARTPLQNQIAKDLQEKAKQKAAETERPDGVDDSKYIEGTKQTSRLALVWLLVILLGLAAIIFLLVVSASR